MLNFVPPKLIKVCGHLTCQSISDQQVRAVNQSSVNKHLPAWCQRAVNQMSINCQPFVTSQQQVRADEKLREPRFQSRLHLIAGSLAFGECRHPPTQKTGGPMIQVSVPFHYFLSLKGSQTIQLKCWNLSCRNILCMNKKFRRKQKSS